jgi:hypothetical protein
VAVNGQPVKGNYVGRTGVVNLSPTGNGAIADVTRTALREHLFEILQPDGTTIGTIISVGLSGGPAPPGMPSTERGNWAIVGGSEAFLGARGTVGGTDGVGRAASMAENPANRHINGGTAYSFLIHVIPMSVPHGNPDRERTSGGPFERFLIRKFREARFRWRGFVFVRHRAGPYGPGGGSGTSLSFEPVIRSQLTAYRDGKRKT